ncbi:hypothetical protein DQ04_06411030 [Trypanosoma grayi]|uniref:hypothetical protein n=1 Tax=Trypanosoma grayi TaxID=71804 RepID=UPI0004F42887|nr:hypothetical protein DQ04_06411030 [Trypanosoma grayi]KEG08811.1 hypothetical protein DQ04_06411030 [Trypanosoma grayi]
MTSLEYSARAGRSVTTTTLAVTASGGMRAKSTRLTKKCRRRLPREPLPSNATAVFCNDDDDGRVHISAGVGETPASVSADMDAINASLEKARIPVAKYAIRVTSSSRCCCCCCCFCCCGCGRAGGSGATVVPSSTTETPITQPMNCATRCIFFSKFMSSLCTTETRKCPRQAFRVIPSRRRASSTPSERAALLSSV